MGEIGKNTISVIGLGKLGLCFASVLAMRDFNVLGIDIDKQKVDLINKGKAPFFEPGLEDLIAYHSKRMLSQRLVASTDHNLAINETDISVILVATPSDTYGKFSNKYVEEALKSLAKSLKQSEKSYHLFIISSTVMPESAKNNLIPIIEQYSGRVLNEGFGLTFVPDFVALGSVIKDYLNPDFVLIGESDRASGDITEEIFRKICQNNAPIVRMGLTDAEVAKISLNCYITMKISFANTLANLCERIPDANVDNVTSAIGLDKRISPYYLKGGTSFGGACFPRDTKAFIALAEKYHLEPELMKATDSVNNFQDEHLIDIVSKKMEGKTGKVAILGVAFKSDTAVMEESVAMRVIPGILRKKLDVIIYDKLANDQAKQVYGDTISYAESITDCVADADVILLPIKNKEYQDLPVDEIKSDAVIIDCWRILNRDDFKKDQYIGIGLYNGI